MISSAPATYLLNPGPVNLSEWVRRALLRPDLCHREPEYSRLQEDVRRRLAAVYRDTADRYTSVLLTGSGTAAVEAMLASLVPRDGRVLVAANGVYGERMAAMVKAHRKPCCVVRSEWVEPIDLAAVDRALRSDGPFTHVAAVHHETTTGRLNDIAALGEICRAHRVPLLLDAVSSFGGEQLDLEAWNVEGIAATANKCLHGVPGVSFVLVRRDALASRETGAPTLYLDLFGNYEQQRQGIPAFTPAVQTTYALQAALIELEEEGGWQQRRETYSCRSQLFRAGLRDRGYRRLLPDEAGNSSVLTSYLLPDGVVYADFQSYWRAAGYVIYAGQGWLSDRVFRIAVMGQLDEDAIGRFLQLCPPANTAAPAIVSSTPAPGLAMPSPGEVES